MRTTPLYSVTNVALNGSGNGTATAGPQVTGETWNPANVAVSVSTNVKESVATLHVNGSLIDSTLTGSTGDSSDSANAFTFYPGQTISVTWTGGDAGSTATMVISGTRQIS